jgi:hypothetical protein
MNSPDVARVVPLIVVFIRFPVGIFGLWYGTRRFMQWGCRNEKIGSFWLAIGFLALLLPW